MSIPTKHQLINLINSLDNNDDGTAIARGAEYFCSEWDLSYGYKQALIETITDQYDNHEQEINPDDIKDLLRNLEINVCPRCIEPYDDVDGDVRPSACLECHVCEDCEHLNDCSTQEDIETLAHSFDEVVPNIPTEIYKDNRQIVAELVNEFKSHCNNANTEENQFIAKWLYQKLILLLESR